MAEWQDAPDLKHGFTKRAHYNSLSSYALASVKECLCNMFYVLMNVCFYDKNKNRTGRREMAVL